MFLDTNLLKKTFHFYISNLIKLKLLNFWNEKHIRKRNLINLIDFSTKKIKKLKSYFSLKIHRYTNKKQYERVEYILCLLYIKKLIVQ